MFIFYSPSLGAFGDEDSHGARMIRPYPTPDQEAAGFEPPMIENPSCRIPDDAVEVSAELRDALLVEQGEGKILRVVDGAVVAVEPDGPRPDEQMVIVRSQRDRMLRGTDHIVAVSDFAISSDRLAELIAWRAALRDVPDNLDPDAPFETVEWPVRPAWLTENFKVLSSGLV